MEDLDKVMALMKKLGSAEMGDVDSLKQEVTDMRDELKSKYNEQDTGETNSQEA